MDFIYGIRWDVETKGPVISYMGREYSVDEFTDRIRDKPMHPRVRAGFAAPNGQYQEFSKIARSIDAIFDFREKRTRENRERAGQ